MSLESFEQLWWNSHTPTVWCQVYAHPLHRFNPVILNYEDLPEPYKTCAQEEHIGKTGDRVHLTFKGCFECKENIRNGGVCDPV